MYPKSSAIFPSHRTCDRSSCRLSTAINSPQILLCELTYALEILFPLLYVLADMVSSCMHQACRFVFNLSLDVSIVNLCVVV